MNFYKKLLSIALLGAFFDAHSSAMSNTTEFKYKGETIKVFESLIDINIEDRALADYFLTSLSNFNYYIEGAANGDLEYGLSIFLADTLTPDEFEKFSDKLHDLKEEMFQNKDNGEIKEKVVEFREIINDLNEQYGGEFLKSFENCILSHTYDDYLKLLDAVIDAL